MEITSKTSFNSTNIEIIKIICVFVGRILYLLLLFLVKHFFCGVNFLDMGIKFRDYFTVAKNANFKTSERK